MALVEAANEPLDPAQTDPAAEAGELTGSGLPGQPVQGGYAAVASADGSPALTVAAASASEADGVLRFTVTLSRAAGTPVSVAYQTANGSATAGQDYVAAGGRLTFPAESTAAQPIEVTLHDDRIDEPSETIAIVLSVAQGAALAVAGATGVILDNDTRALEVQPLKLPVAEGGEAAVAVALGSQPSGDVTVTIAAPTAAELTVAPDRLVFTARELERSSGVHADRGARPRCAARRAGRAGVVGEPWRLRRRARSDRHGGDRGGRRADPGGGGGGRIRGWREDPVRGHAEPRQRRGGDRRLRHRIDWTRGGRGG